MGRLLLVLLARCLFALAVNYTGYFGKLLLVQRGLLFGLGANCLVRLFLTTTSRAFYRLIQTLLLLLFLIPTFRPITTTVPLLLPHLFPPTPLLPNSHQRLNRTWKNVPILVTICHQPLLFYHPGNVRLLQQL